MALHGGPHRRSCFRLAVWISYWLGLFVVTHVPVRGMGRLSFNQADKIVHFVMYFLLVWLGGRYLLARERAPSTAMLLGCAGGYLVFAALDEWLQQFVRRNMSLGDWLADAAGIVLATLWLLYRKRRSGTIHESVERANQASNHKA